MIISLIQHNLFFCMSITSLLVFCIEILLIKSLGYNSFNMFLDVALTIYLQIISQSNYKLCNYIITNYVIIYKLIFLIYKFTKHHHSIYINVGIHIAAFDPSQVQVPYVVINSLTIRFPSHFYAENPTPYVTNRI